MEKDPFKEYLREAEPDSHRYLLQRKTGTFI